MWLFAALACSPRDSDDPAPTECRAPGVATVCDDCPITLDWSELEAELDGAPVAPTDVDGATLIVADYPVDQVECTVEIEDSQILGYQALGVGDTSLVLDAGLLAAPPDTNLVVLLVGDETVLAVVLVPDPEEDTDGLLLH
jgi:hypothetical protein